MTRIAVFMAPGARRRRLLASLDSFGAEAVAPERLGERLRDGAIALWIVDAQGLQALPAGGERPPRILLATGRRELERLGADAEAADEVLVLPCAPVELRLRLRALCGCAAPGIETALAQTESALRESRRFLGSVISNLPGAVYRARFDGDWVITYVSEGIEQLTGYTPAEIEGRRVGADPHPIHRDDCEALKAVVQQALARRGTYDMDIRLFDRQGNPKWVRDHGRGVFDEAGNLLFLEGLLTDIGRSKAAEEGLKESERRFRLAVQAAHLGVWEWWPQEGKVWASGGICRLLGLPPDQPVPGPEVFRPMIHPEDWHLIERGIEEIRGGADEYACEYRALLPGERTMWIAARGQAFRDEAGRPARMLGVTVDITPRKQAELTLMHLNDELEAKVRQRTAELQTANQELEEFSYSMAHDLRAPLRAITGFAQILDEELGPCLKPEQRTMLGRVVGNAVRMGQLIDDLLEFARIGRAELEQKTIDMQAMARQVVEELLAGRELDPKPRIRIGELPLARGDAVLIHQALMNLVDNAIKFSAPRSLPEIEIGGRVVDADRVEYHVRDNGAGFDPAYTHKLFKVFQRLHGRNAFEGTGVGLAIVARIVQRHGGTVLAQGEPDRGAQFCFTLPAG